METNKKVAPKGGSKFMNWYESYQGKKIVGCVYSLGASIVIIGALFKIMHFPGAGPMLVAGMSIEALLFAIGCLDRPHAEFHWENVFPQLMGHGADPALIEELESRPRPTLLGGAPVASTGVDASAVGASMANLAKTADQIKELGSVATAANELVSKLEAAGQTADQFVVNGKVIVEKSASLGKTYAQVSEDMQNVVDGTKECGTQVASASANLQKLNAVYELQMNQLQAQADAYKAQTEKVVAATAQVEALTANVQTLTTVSADALKSHEAYAAGAKQLASQVADLNKVYGNMLNALS